MRGAEKNLQLYHQLSGRAGRTGKPAVVYFQTYSNNPKMILDITNSNPEIFLERELEIEKDEQTSTFSKIYIFNLNGRK